MIGPHAQVFRQSVHGNEPEWLVSLALQALTYLPTPLVDGPNIVKEFLAGPWNYTACHEVADQMNVLLGTAAAPQVATNANGRQLAQNALAGNNVIWLKYAQHSITLVSHNNTVQSIEAWAGSAPGTHGRVICLPFFECIFDDLERIDVANAAAINALNNVQNAAIGLRDVAWNTLCRAGGAAAFEGGTADRTLTATVRPLDTIPNITGKFHPLVPTARTWALRYSREILERPYCATCWTQHGWMPSGPFGRWHWCATCRKSYCDACGAGMQRPVGNNWARTRRCVPCNATTELI